MHLRTLAVPAALLSMILFSAGCHRKPKVTVLPPPPPPVTPAPQPVSVVLEPPVIVVPATPANDAPAPAIDITPAVPGYVVALETADRDFARSDYASAARNFQEYVRLVSAGGQRDHALYHLGLIYAMPGPPAQDWTRATDFFTQLIKETPSSPYVPAANLILTLRRQAVQLTSDATKREERIRQLNTELERLRRIDSDRRPR